MLLVKTEPRVMQGLPNNPTVNAVLWEKAYGGSLDDGAKSIVLCSDGGYCWQISLNHMAQALWTCSLSKQTQMATLCGT